MSELYVWLQKSIEEYYQFVRTLKKQEGKEILLYQHKETKNPVVLKKMKGIYPAYERLSEVKSQYLAKVLETVCDGKESLIMEEYVDGMSVADILESKVFTKDSMCRIVIQICDGLYVLHRCGIIHRDIKPENIMLQPDGAVKIIDFDVARLYKGYEQKDTIMLGTIGYAAPEQYGEAQSDERTDIYALGILMNVMLTGKHPVNKTVNGKIGEVIGKCIRVEPNKRYQNVLEIKEKLKKMVY